MHRASRRLRGAARLPRAAEGRRFRFMTPAQPTERKFKLGMRRIQCLAAKCGPLGRQCRGCAIAALLEGLAPLRPGLAD